jgi:hemolysin activation/secretion protein
VGDSEMQAWRSRACRLVTCAGALCGLLLAPAPLAAREPQIDPRQSEKVFDAFMTQQKRRDGRPPVPQVRAPEATLVRDRKPLFKLTGVSIGGATAISAETLAAAYRPYLGRTVSKADLADITTKISEMYREAGYSLSRALIPPQDINGGRIRIKVVEGAISDVVLKGDGAEQFGIRSLLTPLTQERPARLATLERQLLLASDIPGIRIADTALEELGAGSGKFRLIVFVEAWRVYTTLGLDNRGTPPVGPLQGYVASAVNSLLQASDTLAVNLSTIPDATQENGYSRVLYEMPLGLNGTRLSASVSYGEVWPNDETRATNTHTATTTAALKATFVAWRGRDSSLWLSAAAAYSDVVQENDQGTKYNDHVRTASLSGDYQLQDRFGGFNYFSAALTHGADIMGASQKDDPLLSRDDGSGRFWKFNYAYTRFQKLSDVWSLNVSTIGQLASTGLLASEEFYLGGALFGRGYNSGELSGDSAVAASIELRFDQETRLGMLKGYQLYGFLDGGRVWDFGNGATSLSSAGGGIRFYFPEQLQAGIEVAVPLTYRPSTNPDRDPRTFFFIAKSFKFCPEKTWARCPHVEH